MKVDSKGQPVSEGTCGLYNGNHSARVTRTFVDPTADDADRQQLIAEGAYMVDLGKEDGVIVALPEDFTATYDADHVKAQDGQDVEPGDKVLLKDDGEVIRTIKSIYPIGTLQGLICASLKGVSGKAPDGGFAVKWGNIVKVVEKANPKAVAKDGKTYTTTKYGPIMTPVGPVWVGDRVLLVKDTIKCKVVVTAKDADPVKVKLKVEESLGATAVEVGNESVWFTKRVTKIISRGEHAEIEVIDQIELEVGDRISFLNDDGDEVTGVVTQTVAETGQGIVTVRLDDPEASGLSPSFDDDYWVNGNVLGIIEDDDAPVEGSETQMVTKRNKSVGKVDVVREGRQIILPDSMGIRTAIAELTRQAEQEEMDVNIMEIIHGFPLDAAHAFVKALEQRFGWVNALPTPGFFGPQPPTMVGIVVDPDGNTVQIPWGQLGIPGITGKLSTGIQHIDNRAVFCIGGTIKQKDKYIVNELAQYAREYLKNNSIYKGKAIRVKFPDAGTKVFSPLDHQPKFIYTSGIRPEELIFSAGVAKQVAVNIWTPIRCLQAAKNAKVPLKRGVLLYGRYGVGKTLLASVTAQLCVQAGITFMDLEDSRQLPQAVQFGRMFGGMVVIFAEDIDRCDENGTRTDAFNEILNTVDGLVSKSDEVLIVYTTNHIEKISKAMLRQGRIDKVIHIKEPDADACQKLVRLYARHMLAPEEDIREVGQMLVGFIPAAIREVVEQSKLAAIERGDVHHITAEDLAVTVQNTLEHNELLREPVRDDRSELERLGDAFGSKIAGGLANALWHGVDLMGEEEPGIKAEILRNIRERVTARKAAA